MMEFRKKRVIGDEEMSHETKYRLTGRLMQELKDTGWKQAKLNPYSFYHPEFGTHNILVAATLQREYEKKRDRNLFFTIVGLLLILYGGSFMIGYIIKCLGGL